MIQQALKNVPIPPIGAGPRCEICQYFVDKNCAGSQARICRDFSWQAGQGPKAQKILKMPDLSKDGFLTTPELCLVLNVSWRTVFRHYAEGGEIAILPRKKIGDRWRYPTKAVREFLQGVCDA